jgi:hypothetical protein
MMPNEPAVVRPPGGYAHCFFVSYPHAPEQNIVTEFVTALSKSVSFLIRHDRPQVPVYVDVERRQPGFEWSFTLARALCLSRCMLLVYTDDYFQRKYCHAEWQAMLRLEQQRQIGARRLIIPIILQSLSDYNGAPALPPELASLDCLDFRNLHTPRKQFQTNRVLQKVQKVLDRLEDIKKHSREPVTDCDLFTLEIQDPPARSRPAPHFPGSWGPATHAA